MNDWLNTNADGLAFAFWMGCLALACLGVAKLIEEVGRVRDMRRRARHWQAIRRYVESIGADAWPGTSS